MMDTRFAPQGGQATSNMSSAAVHSDADAPQGGRVPACQWSFNRARQFHHISGDSLGFFHHPPAELLRRHVSIIDDSQGTWSIRLDRMFSGQAAIDQWTDASSEGEYVFILIPVHADDAAVIYTAGFGYRGGASFPAASELELAAIATLQVVETERARATRFLHDVVAQSLSGTGLQLELLQLEIRARNAEALKRAAEIQQSLEEVLKLVREFSAPQP